MKQLQIKNFEGGLSLLDPTEIEDNQFERLKNFFYDRSKRVQTRRGYVTFGDDPDSKPTTSYFFFQRDDGGGKIAVRFSGTKAYKYDEGTDAWTEILSGLTEFEASNPVMRTRWSFAVYKNEIICGNGVDDNRIILVPSGVVVYASAAYLTSDNGAEDNPVTWATVSNGSFRITVDGTAYNVDAIDFTGVTTMDQVASTVQTALRAATGGTEIVVWNGDKFVFYSNNSTGNSSISVLTTSTGTVGTDISGAGLNEWLDADTGNGVVVNYTEMPKIRYFAYIADTTYGFGDDENPITLYYSDAGAVSARNFVDNSLVVGGEEEGKGTGVFAYNQTILAGKERKIYSVDVANTSSLPIDTQNGLYSNRALSGFGNSTIYFNDLGINSLTVRQGVEGGQAFIGDTLSEDIQPALEGIQPRYYNSNCGYFIPELANYYFSYDSTNEDTPDKTLVLSRRTKSWSTYTIPAAYQYGQYITDDGEIKYLIASALSGQMYEIENGFSDDGIGIDFDLLTKQWDFGEPSLWKDFEAVDIYGTKNEGSEINIQILIDGDVVAEVVIDDDNIDITDTAFPIGVKPIGVYPIGGGGSETVDTFYYQIRIPLLAYGGGNRIQVRMYSGELNDIWTLEKMTLTYEGNTFDMFEYNRLG